MAVAKNAALSALPDEKKALLKELTRRFDLDWTDAEIVTGAAARYRIDQMDRPKQSAFSERKEREAAIVLIGDGDKPLPSPAPVVKAPVVPACWAAEGGSVCLVKDRSQVFEVERVEKRPFGRTGYWCFLKGRKAAIELADLEPVE